ncbi:hypothetical protein [Bergeriella denitrificans]|uniref:Periplasmic protein n=1 Tax=Bergeriella denitrificans TaxID=494 RepID=A0A378UJ81_BERDE|nr:Periplasmic protein [Bergeriella denitrificans]
MVPRIAISLLALAAPWAAWGSIYSCESGGVVRYTDKPLAHCRAADLSAAKVGRYSSGPLPFAAPAAPKPSASAAPQAVKAAAKKTPAAKPVAAKNTANAGKTSVKTAAAPPVKAAANSRRSILEAELGNERRALAQAQKALAEARTAQTGSVDKTRVAGLQEAVSDRQQNIQALQRELGRM